MPFKIKLKKSKQYNVASKNVFVVSVELLDNTTVECTLSSASVGYECLSSVCQRLGLHQSEFFGLRYLSKCGGLWWVDLERPLKKQLDRYAQQNQLYLGVLFFSTDVAHLRDEVTRYHYFLQLKSDIINGHLKCSQKQAILLASYSLQAEFGDHDPERHGNTEYLMNFLLLPKHMTGSKEMREALTEELVQAHRQLQGLSPTQAEVCYIVEAQQLDGYGHQCFVTRDHVGATLQIGVSLTGIFVKQANGHAHSFRWNEIVNLVHHKKNFGIECHHGEKTVHYHLEDTDYAKYVWKMCVQQHKSYSRRMAANRDGSSQTPQHNKQLYTTICNNHMQASQESLDELGVYHTEESYTENPPSPLPPTTTTTQVAFRDSSPKTEMSFLRNRQSVSTSEVVAEVRESATPSFVLPMHSSDTQLHIARETTKPSFLRLSHQELDRRALLPSYREAPDYETAIRTKYGIDSSSLGDVSVSSALERSQGSSAITDIHPLAMQSYAQYRNYTDLSHLSDSSEIHHVPLSYSNLMMPPTHTYSTPELNSQGLTSDLAAEQMLMNLHTYCYQTKPPPPYPCIGQRPSSSTPDLTRNQQIAGTNTGPDLVSRLPQAATAPRTQQNGTIQRTGSDVAASPRRDSSRQQNNSVANESNNPAMGPMLVAAMNGLTLSPPDLVQPGPENVMAISRDIRIHLLEKKISEGQFFLEFEQIPKKKPMPDFRTALLPENFARNRFKDVLPYEENRVRLTPSKENRHGYINASHISVSVGSSQRFYIAAQGPLPNTVHAFWQMVWEQHTSVIVMLTEVQELGHQKCHPYWPQQDNAKLQVGEFQVVRNFGVSSSTYTTCSLLLGHATSRTERSVWHIQYTDWPDHGCPQDTQGFLSFMEEVDAVRRLALNEQPPGPGRNAPILVHCSAGVGRSGVVILCDVMLYSLDHANESLDMPKVLTQLRFQRMLSVQTLAQYSFVYTVLIRYLKNSRLI